MDIIAKIDRTLLDNELRSIIRFAVFRESDRALFNPTYHISIVVYNGQIRFTIDHSVSGRSVESSLYEYEDPSLYKLFLTIIKLIKDKCDKNG